MTCDTSATESFGRAVTVAGSSTLPGASPHRRLLVKGTHTTVALRLLFRASPWTTTIGRRKPGPDPVGFQPTRSRLEISPLSVLEDATRRRADDRIRAIINLRAHTMHCLGHLVGCVTRDILGESGAEHFAARSASTACQPFDLFEHIVGNRHGGLHTPSITVERPLSDGHGFVLPTAATAEEFL